MKRKSAYSPSAREKLAFKIPVRRSGQRHYSISLKRCTPSKCASKRTFATLLPFAIARKMPVPSCQVAPGPGGKAHALSPRHGAHRGGGPPPGLRPPPGGGGPLLLALAEEGLLEVADGAVTPAQMEEAYRRYLGKVAGLGLAKAVLEDREGR